MDSGSEAQAGSGLQLHEEFDASLGWQLHPRVGLRPEPFGALAYHYDNRRLNFLRSRDLVTVVESLAKHPSARHALAACGIGSERWPRFEQALGALARSDFLEHQHGNPAPREAD